MLIDLCGFNLSGFDLLSACRKTGGTSPIKVWDAVRKRYILVRPWILFLPGDNPMQAELCSHIGLKGNHFCRCCHVGGDQKFKCSDEGFATLAKVKSLSNFIRINPVGSEHVC